MVLQLDMLFQTNCQTNTCPHADNYIVLCI
nr:MAG TPA: hypothetical protein [Caudoviricetes sp.]